MRLAVAEGLDIVSAAELVLGHDATPQPKQ
jgi:hypothetical protein